MPAQTAYATAREILEAAWTAVPTTPGAIQPYPSSPATGGYVRPAPPLPSVPPIGTPSLEAQIYVDSAGRRSWLPTPGEQELIDRVTANPYDGMDELLGRGAVGRATGSNIDDVIGQLGGRGGLGAGGVVAGAFAAYGEYSSGGGVASAVGVGVGAGAGSVAGTVVGGLVGSALGPAGTVVGGAIGGMIGSAIGGAIGDALIPDANTNGAQYEGPPQFEGGQCVTTYLVQLSNSGGSPATTSAFANGPIGGTRKVGPNAFGAYSWFVTGQTDTFFRTGAAGENWSVSSVSRTDGGADNCGNPAGQPTLYDPNGDPTKTRPIVPPIELPPSPLPRLRPGLPNAPRLPDPDGYRPTGEPVPGTDEDGEPIAPGVPDGYPTGDPAPYPDPGPDPTPDGDDGNDGGNGEEPCDPCAKLDEILELLKPEIAGEIDLSPCPVGDNSPQDIRTVEGTGLTGISSKLDLALDGVSELWELLRCGSDTPMLLTPEWWAYRAGSERPQLLVVYAMKNDDGSWSRTRFQFNIPWFDNRKRKVLKSILPKKIQKGRHQGTLTLSDNSKMIQFCKSQSEAERVLKTFEQLVINRYKTGDIRFADTNGNARRKFREITVELMEARYYAQGQRQESPSWRDKFY